MIQNIIYYNTYGYHIIIAGRLCVQKWLPHAYNPFIIIHVSSCMENTRNADNSEPTRREVRLLIHKKKYSCDDALLVVRSSRNSICRTCEGEGAGRGDDPFTSCQYNMTCKTKDKKQNVFIFHYLVLVCDYFDE